jgi:hypothetical protein
MSSHLLNTKPTKTISKNVPDYDIEHSETLLYHIHVLEEMGEHSEALTMLDASSRSRIIVDRTAIIETRGKYAYTSTITPI